MNRKHISFLLSCSLAAGLFQPYALYAQEEVEVIYLEEQNCYKNRSVEEVRTRYEQVKNTGNDIFLYTTLPNTESAQTASAGVFNPEAKQPIADYVNFNRWLAGMDSLSIGSDSAWNVAGSAAALLQINNLLTHYPEKPEGMNDEFFNAAYLGTTNSNLGYILTSWEDRCFETVDSAKDQIDRWLDDNTNISGGGPGHRFMMLDRTSYAFAFGASDNYSSFYRDASTAQKTENNELVYAWPSPGPFPAELVEMVYWSVNIDTSQIRIDPDLNTIHAVIRDASSGKVLTERTNSNLDDYYSYIDAKIGFSRGWGDCIFFRPIDSDAMINCSIDYQVEISGLESVQSGRPIKLIYTISPEAAPRKMHRLYNPNSGEHFYTAADHEKDYLVTVGWKYEGVGWKAPEKSQTPVYRLYNENAGDHHYTLDSKEKDFLVKSGWKDEGIGWYSDDAQSVPLYRQYNPNARAGSHNYTPNETEHNFLISSGWNDEGIAWYGLN